MWYFILFTEKQATYQEVPSNQVQDESNYSNSPENARNEEVIKIIILFNTVQPGQQKGMTFIIKA
jgi:hypothetical protein